MIHLRLNPLLNGILKEKKRTTQNMNTLRTATLVTLATILIAGLMVPTMALANTVCPTTTLAAGLPPPAYENTDGSPNGFVCDFGGLEFSNFHSNAPGIHPASMGISPGFEPGTTPPNTNPGFSFAGPFRVGSGGLQDVFVTFTVTALTGLLTDVHIQLDNSFVTGTGNISYTEQVCFAVANCAVFVDNPTGTLIADMVLSTPQKSINISKDLILSGGREGTATMSEFSNYYSHTSEVPEPRFYGLVLLAILGGGLGARRWAQGKLRINT